MQNPALHPRMRALLLAMALEWRRTELQAPAPEPTKRRIPDQGFFLHFT